MLLASPHRDQGPQPGHDALDGIVARHERRLRRVARYYGLSSWDVDDVVQAAWLQYLEHGHALREPAALGAWLETTARRLSLRLLQRHVREQLTERGDATLADADADPEPVLLAAERRAVLLAALAALPERQQRLMRVLVLRPELSYEEVGRHLAMPVGSIGPTRARCLERLRLDHRVRALAAA